MMYEDVVADVCGEGWDSIKNSEDHEGGLAVAIVLSYLKGIKPSLPQFASHLKMSTGQLGQSFKRLLHAGIFSREFNARADKELLGISVSGTCNKLSDISDKEVIRNAWCHIAAIGAGVIMRDYKRRIIA